MPIRIITRAPVNRPADGTGNNGADDMDENKLHRLREIIGSSRRIVFFGGAGVSTASGIPDFRSAGGLRAREESGEDPEMSFFYLHPEAFFD